MTPTLPGPSRALRRISILVASALLLAIVASSAFVATGYAAGGTSLRFYGTDSNDRDRIQVPLGPISGGRITSSFPINVGGDFTLEFWMKADAAANSAPRCDNGWYNGNIIVDRDVFGEGDYGDYGVALCDGRIAAGVAVGADEARLIADAPVADGQWHHIALTRADGGAVTIFVDGRPAGSTQSPAGRVEYRAERDTTYPADPYLVLGAEKHNYPGALHYDGLLDDLRVSNVVRYSGPFARPDAPHPVDAATVALYRFDEGTGTTVGDSSGAQGGPSDGELIVAGDPAGPAWSTDTPFATAAPVATAAPAAAEATSAPVATAAPAVVLVTAAPISAASTPSSGATLPATSAPAGAVTSAAPAPTTTAPSPAGGTSDAAAAAPVADTRPPPQEPPPDGGFNTLLFAWLAAAMFAAAVVAAVRWRARR